MYSPNSGGAHPRSQQFQSSRNSRWTGKRHHSQQMQQHTNS